VLASQGFYEPPRISSRLVVILRVLRSSAFLVFGLILLIFFARMQFARSVVILVGAFGGLFVYARHELIRWLETSRLVHGQARRRILWIGLAEESARLRQSLTASELAALENVADFDPASGRPRNSAALA